LLHEKLSRQAYYDHVTGLANRELFNDRFDQALKMAERHKRVCALLYIDLDGFKKVNDTMGHHIGDELLCSTATRMQQCVRKSDTVARMGGDEFAVLLTELQDKSQAMFVGEKIVNRLFDPFQTSKGQVNIGASMGVAIFPDDGGDMDRLMVLADKHMYTNKRQHKQNIALAKEAS
jgi:diguanylate cyclase (GGDEF)-like protein